MHASISAALSEADRALQDLRNNDATISAIGGAAELLTSSLRDRGRIMSCGNGGSHCDAMHFAEEMTGRFRESRRPYAALAISDPAHISCVSNDFGYEEVFSRFVQAHGRSEDVLLGISTSGTSKNIIQAARVAKDIGMKVVTLTGRVDSEVGSLADIDICTPGGRYADRVQELHIKVIHILIELIEGQLES